MSFCPQAKGAGPFLQTESDISRGLCLLPSGMACFSDRAPRGDATHPAPPCKGHLLGQTEARPLVCTGAGKKGGSTLLAFARFLVSTVSIA